MDKETESLWVHTSVDDSSTINDGGVKIDLMSYDDGDQDIITKYPPQQKQHDFDSIDLPMDFEGLKDHLASQVAGNIFKDTKKQAQSFINFYAHIDWIRPYFDVVPTDVISRLSSSIVPGMKPEFEVEKTADLYGPVMVVFTLISILVFTMKNSMSEIKDGTLMGAAFGVCFTYWWLSALWYYLLSFAMAMEIPFLHILSLSGYAMAGFCLSLLPKMLGLSNIVSMTFFALFGTLSGASLGHSLFKRARVQQSGIIAGALAFATHMIFLFYLNSLLSNSVNTLTHMEESVISSLDASALP